jgi:hypothetical protein
MVVKSAPGEVVSPELALVDPELAVRARELLEPRDTIDHLEQLSAIARRSALASGADTNSASPAATQRRVRRRSARAAAGVATAVAMSAALLLGVRVDLRGSDAVADPTTPSSIVDPAQEPPAGVRAQAPQRFAWAPTDGAAAYHVEVFRGATKVFAADTKQPLAELPASWTYGGALQRLDPGEYRWYVWPIVEGRRAASATVQARLIVSD